MIIYTLYYIDSCEIIQSGEAPNADCLPAVPYGAAIIEGVAGIPGEECVENGVLVPYERQRDSEELLAAIERERAIRLSVGFDYDFGDERGVHRIGTTDADERGWDKVTKLASALVAAGNPNVPISVVTDTGLVGITAIEWQHVLIAAAAFQQPIYMKSLALQSLHPIPQNIENSEHWI